MKKTSNFSLFILSSLFLLFTQINKIFAFDYNITFTASGASTNIDYIVVQNVTQGKTITVTAGSVLEVTSINEIAVDDESLRLYPNPIQDKSILSFYSKQGGKTSISIFGVDGKILLTQEKILKTGFNQFKIALPKGAFTIQIYEKGIIHSTKVLSHSNNLATIEFIDNKSTINNNFQKIKRTAIPLQYNRGDIILYKAYSGNYIKIVSDIISESKIINFNFVECKDADGNYYPIVTIGNQIWMAENLKTSQYRNNLLITNKSNDTTWGTLTTEGFSDYSTPSKSTTYGKLYNWFAITDNKNIAPIGWHIPTDAEWTILSDFLGGSNIAGNKLKETGITHWSTPNTNATNETGFTALPGGSRSSDSNTYDLNNIGYWWSATEGTNNGSSWYRYITNTDGNVSRGYYSKSGGMSVRCVMGDFPVLTTSEISKTTLISGGNITYDGNFNIISRGVCWTTSANPTISDSKTSNGTGLGAFESPVAGLMPEKIYHMKAYATNAYGTAYGDGITLSTVSPVVITGYVSIIDETNVKCGGTISSVELGILGRGVCWSMNANPTINDNKTDDGNGPGSFESTMSGLNTKAIYYIRAYATNVLGTFYGKESHFCVSDPFGNASNLVAYFPLESSSDAITTGAGITFSKISEAGSFVAGRRGNAFQGSSYGGYLEFNLAKENVLKDLSEFSYSAWIKTPAPIAGAASAFSVNGGNSIIGNFNLIIESQSNADSLALKPYISNSTTEWQGQNLFSWEKANTTDKWIHVVSTYNKTTSVMSLFVNGLLVNSAIKYAGPSPSVGSQPLLGALTFVDMTKFYIGAWEKLVNGTSTDSWMVYYPGMIDEIRIYNKALSVLEVKDLYTKELSVIN